MKLNRLLPLLAVIAALCMLFSACSGEELSDAGHTAVKDENGNITGYELENFNSDGDITRLDVYDINDEYEYFVLYDYDDDRNLTKEAYYQADGIGKYYYTYSYYDDGSLSEKGYYTMYDGATLTLYDKSGNETERYTYDSSDNLSKYEVCSDGNWLEKPIPTEESTEEAAE